MNTSYSTLATIIILLVVFLYLSWVIVSNKIAEREDNNKDKERRNFLFTTSYALGVVGVGFSKDGGANVVPAIEVGI